MSINAFIITAGKFWQATAKELEKRHGWKICYWASAARREQDIRKDFPEAVFHNITAALCGIPPDELKFQNLPAIDHPLLKDFLFYESMAVKMMDKMDPDDCFSYNERLDLYYQQLRLNLALIEHFHPDVVLLDSIPHDVFSYVLYALCRHKGIKTIMFSYTAFEKIFIPIRYFEDEYPNAILYKKLLSGSLNPDFTLSSHTEDYLEKLRRKDPSQAVAASVKPFLPEIKEYNISGFRIRLKLFWDFILDIYNLAKSISYLARPAYIKRRGEKIGRNFIWSGFEFQLYKFRAKRKKRELLLYYNKLCGRPDFNESYIYVPLHYQPELTSCPLGNFYVNQLLIIELLSKTLPEGWKIYVKENIVQFLPGFRGECSRTTDFYDRLAAFPQVRIIPTTTSTFELIDNSRAVALVAGTAGLEAVVRGKPVMTFGHAWYNDCEGVFYIESLQDCEEAVSKIINGIKIDYDKVRLFLYALEQTGVNVFLSEKEKSSAGISDEENIRTLVKTIQYELLK